MEKNTIIIIITFAALSIIALVLGLVLGLKKFDEDKSPEEVSILNSYDNTPELIKKFPVINNTTVLPGIEERIQNRLLTGFENWNRGFKAWKAWGNILYTNQSIYNVHGARLTLAHYQAAMDISLQKATILMGDFNNMLIIDNFCAIHYDFYSGVEGNLKKSKVMEFVKFKEYGTGNKPDTRVEEGWGSTKDVSYYGLINFQGEEEKAEQERQNNYNLNYQFPNTTDVNQKYYIKYPTTYRDSNANIILQIILEGFENWNAGINSYLNWVDNNYDVNATSSSLDERIRTREKYKEEMNELFKNETITKLYFDNLLIRENWAALHYRFRRYTIEKNETTVGDRMQFLKFEEKDGNMKIVASWIQ